MLLESPHMPCSRRACNFYLVRRKSFSYNAEEFLRKTEHVKVIFFIPLFNWPKWTYHFFPMGSTFKVQSHLQNVYKMTRNAKICVLIWSSMKCPGDYNGHPLGMLFLPPTPLDLPWWFEIRASWKSIIKKDGQLVPNQSVAFPQVVPKGIKEDMLSTTLMLREEGSEECQMRIIKSHLFGRWWTVTFLVILVLESDGIQVKTFSLFKLIKPFCPSFPLWDFLQWNVWYIAMSIAPQDYWFFCNPEACLSYKVVQIPYNVRAEWLLRRSSPWTTGVSLSIKASHDFV